GAHPLRPAVGLLGEDLDRGRADLLRTERSGGHSTRGGDVGTQEHGSRGGGTREGDHPAGRPARRAGATPPPHGRQPPPARRSGGPLPNSPGRCTLRAARPRPGSRRPRRGSAPSPAARDEGTPGYRSRAPVTPRAPATVAGRLSVFTLQSSA